ncbi:DUF6538 domain-containing protein [Bradyrhizobium sp. RDM4]|uniref:DUF6538 domain-containing protein n=1 Tax=Bradyrhizobium sp. RDM4 TaxID=3378765 RepID=UPI0038FBEBE7
MVLRMACPTTKRRGSDNWYYRKRIPADVRSILAKLPKDQRPPSWFKDHISISLKTSDRTAANPADTRGRQHQEQQVLRCARAQALGRNGLCGVRQQCEGGSFVL